MPTPITATASPFREKMDGFFRLASDCASTCCSGSSQSSYPRRPTTEFVHVSRDTLGRVAMADDRQLPQPPPSRLARPQTDSKSAPPNPGAPIRHPQILCLFALPPCPRLCQEHSSPAADFSCHSRRFADRHGPRNIPAKIAVLRDSDAVWLHSRTAACRRPAAARSSPIETTPVRCSAESRVRSRAPPW